MDVPKIKEWEFYKIEPPTGKSCEVFNTVSHIAHIDDAIRIIEDGTIKSSLVETNNLFNKLGVRVSWLSANTWAKGSVYGNVSFKFNWSKIIEGKRFYWVECFKDRSIHAYRILITKKKYESLIPYNPSKNSGPLRKKGNKWYRNGKYDSEFLIDSDLYIHECNEIGFVSHHKEKCRKNNCKHMDFSMYYAGAMVMANLIGRGVPQKFNYRKLFLTKKGNSYELSPDVESAINYFYIYLIDSIKDGQRKIKSQQEAIAVLKAAMAAFGESRNDNYDLALILLKMLGSKKLAKRIFLQKVLTEYFEKVNFIPPDFSSRRIR